MKIWFNISSPEGKIEEIQIHIESAIKQEKDLEIGILLCNKNYYDIVRNAGSAHSINVSKTTLTPLKRSVEKTILTIC